MNGRIQLLSLLDGMSILANIGEAVNQYLEHAKNSNDFLGGILLAVLYIGKELNCRVNQRISLVPGVPLPSRVWLCKYFSFLQGTRYYMSYLLKDFKSFDSLTTEKYIIFYYKLHFGRFLWTYEMDNNFCSCEVDLSSKVATQASWIRLWETYRMEKCIRDDMFDLDEISKTLTPALNALAYSEFNPNFLHAETGLLGLIESMIGISIQLR